MREIKLTSSFGSSRMAEHGRIRLGEKGSKGEPRSLNFWRLTSPDQQAIEILAGRYGGTPCAWNEPKAAVQNQWQVTTTSNELDVLLPENALSVFYEQWAGSGCQRRCDGETCTLPLNAEGDGEEAPCLCAGQGVMLCSPKSRLSVVFPDVAFHGLWTMTTSSWNAAEELSAVEPMVQAMQARGILRAKLLLERRSKVTGSGKRLFPVPKLVLDATPEELASGSAGLVGIPVHTAPLQALGQGNYQPATTSVQVSSKVEEPDVEGYLLPDVPPADDGPYDDTPDSDIVDAELIEQEDAPLAGPDEGMTYLEKQWAEAVDVVEATSGLSRKVIERGIIISASDGFAEKPGQLNDEGWARAVEKAQTLATSGLTVTGVDDEGRLKVKKSA